MKKTRKIQPKGVKAKKKKRERNWTNCLMQALTVEIKKFEKKFTVMVRMKKILEKLG
jgi:hypothetical protein